jgi:hypothetical protein
MDKLKALAYVGLLVFVMSCAAGYFIAAILAK